MSHGFLQAGGLRLAFDPDLGGAILSLTRDGEDLLRPTAAGATDVLETACFPLVPYANRIGSGRFTFAGRTATLRRNMAGQAHPLHGEGWRSAWRVVERDDASASLLFEPERTEWPWRYRAGQIFRLTPDSLTVELSVTNLDDAAGAFGLGLHPYFPHSAEARLAARTTGIWHASDDLLPVEHLAAAPWAAGAPVRSDMLVDHCHTGWSGAARIDLGVGRASLELTASPQMRWLHVFAPPTEDFFCVEPVSHAPNALNMADPAAQGVCHLGPGETLHTWMRLAVV